MVDSSEIAGDVVAGATALAGHILVYLGSLATGYGSYDILQQNSVRTSFRRRAWFGFIGLVLAIGAAGLALFGKWTNIDSLTSVAAALLLISFGWGIVTALLTVREIS
jgi:hypothetical protein